MSNPNNFYSSSQPTELNLRTEMINTLEGNFPEIAKGQKFILRSMNTEDGELIPCPCVDPVTHEPDKDTFCSVCYGEGYIWTESFCLLYQVRFVANPDDKQTGAGLSEIPLETFYGRYDLDIEKHDKIVEIARSLSGAALSPIERTTVWRIQELVPMRGDNGKMEFMKIFCSTEDVKWLNLP